MCFSQVATILHFREARLFMGLPDTIQRWMFHRDGFIFWLTSVSLCSMCLKCVCVFAHAFLLLLSGELRSERNPCPVAIPETQRPASPGVKGEGSFS